MQFLGREKVEAVSSDVLVPGMDGYRLCFEIRHHPKWKALRFMCYTATYSSPGDEKLALDLGADAFLIKPSPTAAIVEKFHPVIKEFEEIPPIMADKHMVLQILVNLVRNAMQAFEASGGQQKRLTVRVRIAVADNGSGSLPENLVRIFAHCFTTRKSGVKPRGGVAGADTPGGHAAIRGHGFGLHSSALAAKKMGGSLTIHSERCSLHP